MKYRLVSTISSLYKTVVIVKNKDMSKEELIRKLFEFPTLDIPVVKTITVEMDKYKDRKGQGTVQITNDGPSGFSQFKTHQVNPIEYVMTREEYKSGEYKLVIK